MKKQYNTCHKVRLASNKALQNMALTQHVHFTSQKARPYRLLGNYVNIPLPPQAQPMKKHQKNTRKCFYKVLLCPLPTA